MYSNGFRVDTVMLLRAVTGLSQRVLAERAGTSQPTIAAYEAGTKSPTWATIERLAAGAGREAFLWFGPPMGRGDRRNFALHVAAALRLQRFPGRVLARARADLPRLRRVFPDQRAVVDEWAAMLEWPVDELVEVMLDPRDRGRVLRRASPLPSAIPGRLRLRAAGAADPGRYPPRRPGRTGRTRR